MSPDVPGQAAIDRGGTGGGVVTLLPSAPRQGHQASRCPSLVPVLGTNTPTAGCVRLSRPRRGGRQGAGRLSPHPGQAALPLRAGPQLHRYRYSPCLPLSGSPSRRRVTPPGDSGPQPGRRPCRRLRRCSRCRHRPACSSCVSLRAWRRSGSFLR